MARLSWFEIPTEKPIQFKEIKVSTIDNAFSNTSDLAELRTKWASERTRLANERTLIAWLRTGLAVTAFGAVVPRLLAAVENDWLVRIVSVLFVFSGTIITYYGVHAYREMTKRLGEDQIGVPWSLVALIAGALEVGAIVILLLFLFG